MEISEYIEVIRNQSQSNFRRRLYKLNLSEAMTTNSLKTKKKIFFIHVSKTAGSSVNSALKEFLHGEDQCQHYLTSWENQTFYNVEYLSQLDYISGHLKIDAFFNSGFQRENYVISTFLRNPLRQLLSHLNWVMHIYDISPSFFANHPKNIQEICLDLRNQNLMDLKVLKVTLEKYSGLFQNNQSRFFYSDSALVGSNDSSSSTGKLVIDRMKQLDFVGLTEYYGASLERLLRLAGYTFAPVKISSENKNSNYRLGKEILENDQIREFLERYNSVDLEVYSFWRSEFISKLSST